MVILEGQLKEVMYKQCVTMMMIYLLSYKKIGHIYICGSFLHGYYI